MLFQSTALSAISPDFSDQQFRQALGMFPTGVTVVTARTPDGALVGLTVSSFNSVSLTPPLVLWSLARKAGTLTAFRQASHYAINVLAADQQALALQFANRKTDRFAGVQFATGVHGAPLLVGAAAHFECFNRSQYPEGDHVIFVGEVERCAHSAHAPALLYHNGAFATHRTA
ncbi:MAG: flavin reductase family protein [Rhodoferax sp.]|nr:flavin reductase family protein [Rhodoferax sp.]